MTRKVKVEMVVPGPLEEFSDAEIRTIVEDTLSSPTPVGKNIKVQIE